MRHAPALDGCRGGRVNVGITTDIYGLKIEDSPNKSERIGARVEWKEEQVSSTIIEISLVNRRGL